MKYGIRDMKYPTFAHFRHFSSLFTNLRSTTVENIRQITPFYAKQTQFCAFFAQKRRFHEKTKPIQTQFNPKQTQFKANQTQSNPISMLGSNEKIQWNERIRVKKLLR